MIRGMEIRHYARDTEGRISQDGMNTYHTQDLLMHSSRYVSVPAHVYALLIVPFTHVVDPASRILLIIGITIAGTGNSGKAARFRIPMQHGARRTEAAV